VPNTRIVAVAGERAAKVGSGQTYGSPGVVLNTDGGFLDRCIHFYGCSQEGSFDEWNASGNAFSFTGVNTATIAFFASCGGGGTCPPEDPSAVGTLFRTEVTLADNSDPQPSAASGSLTQAGAHRGTEAITFNTSDEGSGVYRGFVEIDGRRLVDEVVSENDGACMDALPGDGNAYEFLSPQPCKLSANVSLDFDTSRVSNGDHSIRVGAEDAAGNSAAAYGPAPFHVENDSSFGGESGRTNGANASNAARFIARFWRSHRRDSRVPYGSRVVIVGRLVNEEDRGIGHADVQLILRRAGAEGTVLRYEKARTNANGAFRIALRAELPSQLLRLAYKSYANAVKPAAVAPLRLNVRAGLRLHVRPRAVRNGETIVFRGRLLGRPVPSGGRLIEVQVRHPWGWQTFATARARRDGWFRYARTLRRSFMATTYTFRVRCREESGYAYATGVSNVVKVRVT
jgi:hypothetical protein